MDRQALFKPASKKTWTATGADRLPEMFREAFREAMAPRRGPVQLNLPRDVLSRLAARATADAWGDAFKAERAAYLDRRDAEPPLGPFQGPSRRAAP